jgi:hypothetical protein
VRVVFLHRRGRRRSFSFGFMAAIISALDTMRFSLCLAAAWLLARCTSLWVGEYKSIKASIISLAAASAFNLMYRIKVQRSGR